MQTHREKGIPMAILKDVYLICGTMNLLNKNLNKAIDFLEDCISLEPNPVTRGISKGFVDIVNDISNI